MQSTGREFARFTVKVIIATVVPITIVSGYAAWSTERMRRLMFTGKP